MAATFALKVVCDPARELSLFQSILLSLGQSINHENALYIRDRPFNLKGGGGYGFLFRSENFYRTTQELEYLFFLSCKVQFFFQEFNIRLYDKNSESYYFFFPLPKSEYFFQQH
jgi:hypothetical protein